MKIVLLEPFFSGSHRQWAEGLQQNSRHQYFLLSLKGRHWKWRMYGGAVSLARQFLDSHFEPDLILSTDMLDLATFLALTRKKTQNLPVSLYLHENQITYPWSPSDADVRLQRDNHYGFLNYTAALAADAVFFNSQYHQKSFLKALPPFLKQFPDNRELQNIEGIRKKSRVLPLGLNLKRFDSFKIQSTSEAPILLWSHRWEYDKNPEAFFKALFQLKEEGVAFNLVVLGESFQKMPPIFKEAKSKLSDRILQFGAVKNFEQYARWLWQADIFPVCSTQDFFGGSVVEAIYCNCFPLLPKRLTYPEHIPPTLHATHFYEEESDFYDKLKAIVSNFRAKKLTGHLPDFVAKYDWSILAAQYDDAFEKLAK